MPSISITQLTELLDAEVYPVVLNQYEAQPSTYDRICDVRPYEARKAYGDKSSTTTGLGLPVEIEEGQESPADSEETAWTWYLKNRKFSRRIDVDERLLEQASATAAVDYIMGKSENMGRNFVIAKDDHVAGLLQKGTLTAGSKKYFDNSFAGNADPNPLFIYDGLPFFDTEHTLKGASGTYANHTASLALSAASLQTVLETQEGTNAIDERGNRILNPMDTLLVPKALEHDARVLMNSTLLPGSQNNDANVLQGRLNVIAFNGLADAASSAAWWVGRGGAGSGIRVVDSGAPRMRVVQDDKTGVVSVIWQCYFGATVTDWRSWYCANKAAS